MKINYSNTTFVKRKLSSKPNVFLELRLQYKQTQGSGTLEVSWHMMPSNVDWFADVIKPFVSPFDGANHGIHNFSSNYCNYRPPFPVSNISNHGINYVTCISLSESIFSCHSLYFQFFWLALFPPPREMFFQIYFLVWKYHL